MAPDSSFVMSSRLAIKRLSRSDSSTMVANRSAFSTSVSLPARSRSVLADPSTAASGVLRSCEIEVRSAERRRSVSTVRLTRSMSSTRWTRSIARAPWSMSASSRRRSSGVSSGPGLSRSMPTTPIAPRPVRMGRNNRLAPGSVSEPRPAERLFSQAQFAAARSALSRISSGG